MNASHQNRTGNSASTVQVFFNLYYPPIIAILGIIGNILSFVVYRQKPIRKQSFSLLMRALALADDGMLIVLLIYWFHTNFLLHHITVTDSKRMCFAFTYIVKVFANCAHYLLCSLTISRLISIAAPLKAKIFLEKARLFVVCVCIGSVLKNLHFLSSTDFVFNPKTKQMTCTMGFSRKEPAIVFLRWFETIVTSIAPCVIIIVSNISMVYYLRRKVDEQPSCTNNLSQEMKILRQKRENNITIMVCVVSVSFLIFTVPLYIHRLYVVKINIKDDAGKRSIMRLADSICQKLWYTNNAFNFFIYALVGKEFRKNLSLLLSCKRN